jgi:hypothetical protein
VIPATVVPGCVSRLSVSQGAAHNQELTMRSPSLLSHIAGSSALLLSLVLAPDTAQTHDIFYSGRATGVEGTVTLSSGTKKVLLSNNYMSCFGKPKEENVLTLSNPAPIGVQATSVATYTLGRDDVAVAESSFKDVHLELPNLKIDAVKLQAYAEARCTDGKITPSGSSDVGALFINGQGRTLTGEPNQTFTIPNVGTVIVNEQIKYSREMRVNALHIKLENPSFPASGDIVVSHARAKLECVQ